MLNHIAWIDAIAKAAAEHVGLREPVQFPDSLLCLFAANIELLTLNEARLPTGSFSTPAPEFALLGPDMPDYSDEYEFATYMPGAWPLALDGSGGFFCLDLREVVAARSANDGSAPIVWSHAGSLGWTDDEMITLSDDVPSFLAHVEATPA